MARCSLCKAQLLITIGIKCRMNALITCFVCPFKRRTRLEEFNPRHNYLISLKLLAGAPGKYFERSRKIPHPPPNRNPRPNTKNDKIYPIPLILNFEVRHSKKYPRNSSSLILKPPQLLISFRTEFLLLLFSTYSKLRACLLSKILDNMESTRPRQLLSSLLLLHG